MRCTCAVPSRLERPRSGQGFGRSDQEVRPVAGVRTRQQARRLPTTHPLSCPGSLPPPLDVCTTHAACAYGAEDLVLHSAERAAREDEVIDVSAQLVEWRHTAEIYADPVLHTAATRVLGDDGGPVPRPESPERGT